MRAKLPARNWARGWVLWLASIAFALGTLTYQDRTGPTYPLEGTFQTPKGPVHFKFQRSETIGADLNLVLIDPLPPDISGYVTYKRYQSSDPLTSTPLARGEFAFSRRGRTEQLAGIGARLPGLNERAGKYQFQVYVSDGVSASVSLTGASPIYARYKAAVPLGVLIVHVLAIFASMALGVRTMLAVVTGGEFKALLWATIWSLLLGAFVLGPLVQQYAFGVLWAGVPFGWDWTDNKVLVELAFWMGALYMNRGHRRSPASVYVAGFVMLVVYFIPHSVFGSEYNYLTGKGQGTAG